MLAVASPPPHHDNSSHQLSSGSGSVEQKSYLAEYNYDSHARRKPAKKKVKLTSSKQANGDKHSQTSVEVSNKTSNESQKLQKSEVISLESKPPCPKQYQSYHKESKENDNSFPRLQNNISHTQDGEARSPLSREGHARRPIRGPPHRQGYAQGPHISRYSQRDLHDMLKLDLSDPNKKQKKYNVSLVYVNNRPPVDKQPRNTLLSRERSSSQRLSRPRTHSQPERGQGQGNIRESPYGSQIDLSSNQSTRSAERNILDTSNNSGLDRSIQCKETTRKIYEQQLEAPKGDRARTAFVKRSNTFSEGFPRSSRFVSVKATSEEGQDTNMPRRKVTQRSSRLQHDSMAKVASNKEQGEGRKSKSNGKLSERQEKGALGKDNVGSKSKHGDDDEKENRDNTGKGQPNQESQSASESSNSDLNYYIKKMHRSGSKPKSGDDEQDTLKTRELMEYVIRGAVQFIRSKSAPDSPFGHVLLPFDTSSPVIGGDLLQQVAPSMFRIRLYMENPFPAGAFQLLTGVRHGVPTGQGLLCINPAQMTLVERRQVVKMYTSCFDGEFLSPSKTAQWICKGFAEYFYKHLNKSTWRDRVISGKARMQQGKIRVTITSRDKDSGGDEQVIQAMAFPSIAISGWPHSASLQHPLPRQRPHSVTGQRMLKDMQFDLDGGAKLICLDGTCPAAQDSSNDRPKTSAASVFGRVHQAAMVTIVQGNAWMVSFRLVEKSLMDRLFACNFMADARLAHEVIGMMQERLPLWGALNPAFRRTLMLWTVKRSGINSNTSPGDWFLAFIQAAKKAFSSGFCPQFFQPNVNMLAGSHPEWFEFINEDFDAILAKADSEPEIIEEMCK